MNPNPRNFPHAIHNAGNAGNGGRGLGHRGSAICWRKGVATLDVLLWLRYVHTSADRQPNGEDHGGDQVGQRPSLATTGPNVPYAACPKKPSTGLGRGTDGSGRFADLSCFDRRIAWNGDGPVVSSAGARESPSEEGNVLRAAGSSRSISPNRSVLSTVTSPSSNSTRRSWNSNWNPSDGSARWLMIRPSAASLSSKHLRQRLAECGTTTRQAR